MTIEFILILGLLVVFVLPVVTDINVGLVAFIVAIFLGGLVLDLTPQEIVQGFPTQMFVLIVGVTLLLAVADKNGTVDWVVGSMLSLTGGRLVLLPIVLFVTAFITSSLGPGAAPVLFVIGAGLVGRYGLSPLLVGAMVIHGTQSGAYSPIAPYGVVISQLAADQAISYQPWTLYAAVVVFHLLLGCAAFMALGGLNLRGAGFAGEIGATSQPDSPSYIRYLTLCGFAGLLVAVVGFGWHLGFVALVVAFVLLLFSDRTLRKESVNSVAWPIVLVITGVLTYVSLIQQAGAIEWLANHAGSIADDSIVALMLNYLVSIVTGVASTIGTIGILVPLSAPLMESGAIDGTGLLTSMAVTAAVSDISPFSTWGALFLASVAGVADRERVLRSQLLYTGVMVAVMPLVAWLCFVVFGLAS